MNQTNASFKFIMQNKQRIFAYMEKHQLTWSNDPADESSATDAPPPVQVYVRTRPLLQPEVAQGHYSLINVQSPYHVHLMYPSMRWGGARFATKTFKTDGVFDTDVSSGEVYDKMNVKGHVERCVEEVGRSLTLMAYGQTGSGKTYTMTAIEELVIQDVFAHDLVKSNTVHITLRILEIRGKTSYDLLSSPALEPVKLGSLASGQVDFSKFTAVHTEQQADMLEVLRKAKSSRLTRSTTKNDTSSRSHCIVMIEIGGEGSSEKSVIQIVDLAGSERFADLTQNEAERVKEAVEINKSLAALKECIVARLNASDPEGAKQHVPWRSSQLTTILQQALVSEETSKVEDGSTGKKTVLVVACVSPSPANLESTFNTLKWVMPFQLAITDGSDADSLPTTPDVSRLSNWSQQEGIAYFQRNFPKLAPFVPRLFWDKEMTLPTLSKLTSEEMIRLVSTPSPDEPKGSVPQDAMTVNQAKAQVPSALLRLRRFVEQKNREYEKMMARALEESAKGSAGPKQLTGSTRPINQSNNSGSSSGSSSAKAKKAEIVRGLLDGTRAESVETGLRTWFDAKKGVWVEEVLPESK